MQLYQNDSHAQVIRSESSTGMYKEYTYRARRLSGRMCQPIAVIEHPGAFDECADTLRMK